jgi:hypothetical protein
LSVVFGAAAVLVVRNTLGAESLTFSTSEIVSFLFGIALSSASIVLAIAAISLGKGSERVMIRRSDESIRIQNEVFSRTVEALARIESSTGVTEKRIEDIISGRAGAISDRIAEQVLNERGLQPKSREELEREIRESLVSAIASPPPSEPSEKLLAARRKRETEQEADRKRYVDYKDAVLLTVANLPGIQARKIGDGRMSGGGADLVDGIFTYKTTTFSVSTFATDTDWLSDSKTSAAFKGYIRSLAAEIAKNVFTMSFVVLDRDTDDEAHVHTMLDDLRGIAKADLASRVIVASGRRDHVVEVIKRHLESIAPAT